MIFFIGVFSGFIELVILKLMFFLTLLGKLFFSNHLQQMLFRLCELRDKGITSLSDARLYFKLFKIHEECERQVKTFHANPLFNWKLRNRGFSPDLFMPSKRKSGFTPIEIVGMPGYEKLTPTERELCRTVRLVPVSYLEFKEVLITENKKMGSIKLKTARKILKIDVNKTRRLFDFLVEEGYIVKSAS